LKEYTDQELIDMVKENTGSASVAMTEIITRHSGIFIEMVNHFVPIDSPYCDRRELIDDKKFYIYKALMKYDQTRGTKFSTHLGNEAKWLCLNIYNKNKNKLILPSSNMDYDKELSENPHAKSIERESFNRVIEIIKDYPDERINKIFTMRYIDGEKNRVMPWKKISKELKMSIQGCINIHNQAIKNIQKKVIREC
jgi:hypothetical protein